MRGAWKASWVVALCACLSLSFVAVLSEPAGDETCQADGTGCAIAEEGGATPSVLSEDGISKDIHEMCPLSRSVVRNAFQGLVKWFGRRINLHKFVGLWPKEISPDTWSDDYTTVNYLFVARIALGIYQTRGPEFVKVPTKMASRGIEDIVRVENIHAPRVDVDGSPNFLGIERYMPGFIMRMLYVPAITCFYSTLRRMSTDNNELNGTFFDHLDTPDFNTWEAVLKGTSFKSKLDWVNTFYSSAQTLDGNPVWPRQMTNFQTYLKNDVWDDGLENAFAFHLIGSHRLETGSWTFSDLAGVESLTLPFRIPLNLFATFKVRKHFGKYGADMYFDADGMPTLIETPTGQKVMRGDKQWQYWKFVWRSTLVTAITLVDHLHLTHFRSANMLARVSRETFSSDTPMRRVSSIFTFGSIFVNLQAMHTLIGPNHMLHRATPFKDFVELSNVVPSGDSQIISDLTDIPAIRALNNETEFKGLHPTIQATPFFADGVLVFKAIKDMAKGFFDASYDLSICPKGQISEDVQRMRMAFLEETRAAHYQINGDSYQYMTDEKPCADKIFRQTFENRMATYFFIVSAWHRHVGFVGDYYLDPEIATMSWKDGERFGRPKQHMIMTMINVFTSTNQPLLKADYTHLFQGMTPDLSKEFTAVWHKFIKDLDEIEKIVDERNKKRKVSNSNMHPRFLESAVSK